MNFKYKAKFFHTSTNKVLRFVLSSKVPNISKANNIISNSNGQEHHPHPPHPPSSNSPGISCLQKPRTDLCVFTSLPCSPTAGTLVSAVSLVAFRRAGRA